MKLNDYSLMASGGKVGYKQNTGRKVRSKLKGSDESDEDYKVDEDEDFEESDEYCSSFDGGESEEEFEAKEMEEEQEDEKKVKKLGQPEGQKGASGRKIKEMKKPLKERKVSYKEEDYEDDCDDDDDDNDEEFTLDEIDREDEDEVPATKMNKKVGRPRLGEKGFVKMRNRKRNFKVLKKDMKKKPRLNLRLRGKGSSTDEEFIDNNPVVEEKCEEISGHRRRVLVANSDSDLVSSESSDSDYTISEEEREHIREASKFSSSLATNLRGSTFSKRSEEESFCQQKKRIGRKGKEKVDDDSDDDEEFTLDENEIDCDDEDEDEVPVTKKNKLGRSRLGGKGFVKGRKRKRNFNVLKKAVKKKPRNNLRLRRKACSNEEEFIDHNPVVEDKPEKISGRRRRGVVADSDSDFVCSESFDYDYTISEEEREQIREASEFCSSLTTSLRNSTLSKKLEEEESSFQLIKCPGRKGKEKVDDSKNEVGKQVCGICLSDEGKKIVRGVLNCCGHYFCFACIMEWSKVESRCPLCKQRFVTISKPAKSNTGLDMRTVVIQVPERDQIYQPSQEELRGYLDPYENVICTECQQGGNDALMLLCDLCDSPAHTYCVGLGREVPEGNWYCDACRPTALGSTSNPLGLYPMPDQKTSTNYSGRSSPADNVRVALDLNEMYVPDIPLTQETGSSPSPRLSVGDFQAASSASGSGAFTVSERRRIQRLIQNLLHNRMRQLDGQSNGISATNLGSSLFGTQIGQVREFVPQQTVTPERLASRYNFSEESFQDNSTSLVHNREAFPARSIHSREQAIQNSAYTSVAGVLPAELAGIHASVNSRLGYQQSHPCSSRSTIGTDATMSPCAFREVSHFKLEKEQVQSMVRRHLKSFFRDLELDYKVFKDIARSSTHTILAACGIEHRTSEVCPVQSPSTCNHIEIMGGVQMGLMKGYCSSCFDQFVRNVVKAITSIKNPSTNRG
ncbi:unnamed protein product [Ilex paraguariensis]|uniref:PHD and RING finger domain-containing protein 1 n=1 Tax=Ilex paraguariensis TaxID=185542 RepID=A0ABC8THY0_9AQUA